MKNIDYTKLRKYEIGKMSSIGYEIGLQAPEYQSEVQIGNNLSSETDYYKLQVAPQVISRIGSFVNSATPMFTLLATNIGKKAATETGKTTAKLGSKLFSTSAAKSAASIAGYVTGAASTLMSGFLAYGDTQAAKEKVDPNTIIDTATKYTDTKFGQQYLVYGGADRDAIMNYVNLKNKLDRINMGTSYASTGAGFVSTIGSIFGGLGAGLGMLFGGGIGAAIGLKKSKDFNDDRKEQAKIDITNANNAFYGYNTQSEAVAGSKGLRQQYTYGLADKGKDRNQNLGYPGKIGIVHTAEGKKLGIQYGLGGGGELLVSKSRGSASVINEGKKHVDNIPIGVPIDSPDPDREWDDLVVLGNTKDKATGKNIADEARPYARAVENNGDADAFDKLMYFADVQSKNLKNKNKDKNMYKADNGKPNWGELSSMILPRMLQFGAISAANKSFTPTVIDPYAESNVSDKLNALYNLRHDPSLAIQNARDAGRQATYAIRNSGGISGGLKALIGAMNNHATAKSVNDVIFAYNDKNIESQRAALGAALQAEESRAARHQQANLYTAEARAKAQALPYQQQQAYLKSLHDMFGSIGKDFMAYYDNLAARKYKQLIIDSYNKSLVEQPASVGNTTKPKLPVSLYQQPYLLYFNRTLNFNPSMPILFTR